MSPAQVIPDNTNNYWLFYIRPNGNVVLNGSLDYAKNTFYQIKILAKVGNSQAEGAELPGKGAKGLTVLWSPGWRGVAAQCDGLPEQFSLPVPDHH